MVTALTAHAQCMTGLYRDITKMVTQGVNSEDSYREIFEKADNYSTWYKARKKVAKTMKMAAAPASK